MSSHLGSEESMMRAQCIKIHKQTKVGRSLNSGVFDSSLKSTSETASAASLFENCRTPEVAHTGPY